jgi:hypothetical protein
MNAKDIVRLQHMLDYARKTRNVTRIKMKEGL